MSDGMMLLDNNDIDLIESVVVGLGEGFGEDGQVLSPSALLTVKIAQHKRGEDGKYLEGPVLEDRWLLFSPKAYNELLDGLISLALERLHGALNEEGNDDEE